MDIISSRIESRNVGPFLIPSHEQSTYFSQESEGSEGSIEYDDAANDKQDELMREGEPEQQAVSVHHVMS